jgi:CRISPR-associated protein Csb2
MLVLRVQFLTGRFHATPWGHHVNSGAVEWPPSPWRVLRAIASAELRVQQPERELVAGIVRKLAQELPVFYSPAVAVGHWRAYMPDPRPRESPNLVHDTFISLASREHPLYIVWPTAVLTPLERAGLSRAVRRLRYLGRSESLAAVSVEGEVPLPPPHTYPVESREPALGESSVRLLAPLPTATLADVVMSTDEMRGARRRREPPNTQMVPYVHPPQLFRGNLSLPRPAQQKGTVTSVVAVRYQLAGSVLPSMWDTAVVGQRFRQATGSVYGQYNASEQSPLLSGHQGSATRRGHGHAHFLPVFDPHGLRRIQQMVVWAPDGFTTSDLTALSNTRVLQFREDQGGMRVHLVLVGTYTEDEMHAATEIPMTRTATVWTSSTPFFPSRHPHRRGSAYGSYAKDGPEDEVQRELHRRRLPGAQVVRVADDGTALRFKRPAMHRTIAAPGAGGNRPRPYAAPPVHLRIVFERPVSGPVVLGQWAHLGLGMFEPEEG